MKPKIDLNFGIPTSVEEFNTNNGWGFGGGYGYEVKYRNGLKNRYGTACFRHLPSEKFDRWYILNKDTDEYLLLSRKPNHGEQVRVIKLEHGYKTTIENIPETNSLTIKL